MMTSSVRTTLCLGCGICVGDNILCCYLLAGKSRRVFLDLTGLLLRGAVLLLGATLITTIVPPRTLLLRERMEAEGSVPFGIAIGKGFRNLSMEMEALQEICPASSVSGTREQEVERRTKEKSLPSHPYSLALDHLLHLGGKKVLRRRFSPLPFLSWLRQSRLRSLLGAAVTP
jgi:hypothetical protein